MSEPSGVCCVCGAEFRRSDKLSGERLRCGTCGADLWIAEPAPRADFTSEWNRTVEQLETLDRLHRRLSSVAAAGCGLVLAGIFLPVIVIAVGLAVAVAWPILISLALVGLVCAGLLARQSRR